MMFKKFSSDTSKKYVEKQPLTGHLNKLRNNERNNLSFLNKIGDNLDGYLINLGNESDHWLRLKAINGLSDLEFISYLLNMYDVFIAEDDLDIIDKEKPIITSKNYQKSVDIGIQVTVVTENYISSSIDEQNSRQNMVNISNPTLNIYTCENCDYITTDPNLLKTHINENEGHKHIYHSQNETRTLKKTCPVCNVKCFNERTLICHHKRNHAVIVNDNNKSDYSCEHPGCTFTSIFYQSYVTHMKYQHHEIGLFICEKCGRDFRQPHHLRQHLDVHMRGGRIMQRRKPIKNRSKASEPKNCKCDICGIDLKTEIIKQIHDFSLHSSSFKFNGYYKCPKFETCNFQNETIKSVLHHSRRNCIKIERDGETFKCSFCPRVFNYSRGCYYHEKTHKQREKKHKCSICPKTYYSKKALNAHLITTHSNEKPHKCHVCDKRFNLSSQVNNHMLTHKYGEKPFKCQKCGAVYASACGLKRHERTKHEIEINAESVLRTVIPIC